MEIRTNEEVLEWYKNTLENGKVSEETIKREALKFFKISPDAAKDKKRFKIEVEDFVTKHKNMLRKMEKDCLKESGGSVKSVPADFRPDIEDDRERKKEYLRFARESIRSSKNYQDWLDADCTLFLPADVAKKKVLSLDDKKMVNKYSNNQIKLVRERSRERNIFDAEKMVISKNPDGTIKKSIVKETYAKVTIRKRHQANDENSKEVEVTGAGVLKRAKAVDNILNHTSQHNTEVKASLVAKIIDKEGSTFGHEILKKSKALQETRKLNAEQTAGLMTGSRGSQFLFRQVRSVLNKEVGFNPLASQRKVDYYIENIMVAKKEDWDCQNINIFQNKQGKRKGLPTETPVLGVKNLESYVIKMAESESSYLDLSENVLPICFDADAGGGRFLAVFTFMNREDNDVKLHPYLIYEGSDCRQNMEVTMGTFSQQIRNLEGKVIILNEKVIKIKVFGLFDLCALNCLLGKLSKKL